LKILNFVEIREVVVTLNIPPPTVEVEQAFYRKFDKKEAISSYDCANEYNAYLQTQRAAALRSYVDEWLWTGWREDGSERPDDRNLLGASGVYFALMSYMERYPAEVELQGDPPELSVRIGEISALHSPSGNPMFDVRIDAIRLFLGIFASEQKRQLCKCRHCGRYFLHPHPRKVYRRGTFCCRQHQSHASAVQRTKTRRLRVKSELIETAASELVKSTGGGSEWKGDYAARVRLARQLSKYVYMSRDPEIRAQYPIRVHWVTRNRDRIEQRRVELTNPG
jgi:hypothetical protein